MLAKKPLLSCTAILLLSLGTYTYANAAASAGDDPGKQLQTLNQKIQDQLQKIQADQQKQLQTVNQQLQAQVQKLQSEQQKQLQTMNKQFQDQIKKAQTNLESEIQTLNSQINKVPVASPKPGQ